MRHLSYIIALLIVSVLTTACINNLAVQKLNDNAKSYIEKGDTESAICRLKSSLELDNQMYETHYNLGIAYLTAKMYDKAQEEFKATIELNPGLDVAYYSYAIALEEEAIALEKPPVTDEDKAEGKAEQPQELSVEQKALIVQKLNEAIQMYDGFVQRTKSTKEQEEIKQRIESIQNKVQKLESGVADMPQQNVE